MVIKIEINRRKCHSIIYRIETAKGIDFNHPKTEIQSKFDENKMLREKTDSQKEEIKTIKHPNNRKIISPRIIETHKEYCESITHK